MLTGIDFENTPDFEYLFEDIVKLPEFELYHIGLGIYRFAEPLFYNVSSFRQLEEKYASLRFFYINKKDEQVKLLYVMSRIYNVANIDTLDNILVGGKLPEIFSKGYDTDVDKLINWTLDDFHTKERVSIEDNGRYARGENTDRFNRLLGFQWESDRYYDQDGTYIMIDGCVAKRIATGLYAFQGIKSHEGRGDRYPLIPGGVCSQEFESCAVVGVQFFDEGAVSIYLGTRAKYIAFDDIGISSLRKLYEQTAGYEFKRLEVAKEKEPPIDLERILNDAVIDTDTVETKQRLEKQKREYEERKNAYGTSCIGEHATELFQNMEYKDITIHYRILLHQKVEAVSRRLRQFDYVYFEDDMLKIIEIDRYKDNITEHKIPVKTIAELYVMKKTEFCPGVEEDLLFKVIDNTDIEKTIVGADQYESFMRFI